MLTFFKEEKNIGYKQDQGAIYNQVGMLYWETKIGLFSVHMLHIEWQLIMSLHVCIYVHLRTSSCTCVCTLKVLSHLLIQTTEIVNFYCALKI